MAGNLTTRFLFKQQAGITSNADDQLIDTLLAQVCGAVEEECGRTFASTTYKSWLDGTGTPYLILPQWPVTKIHKVTDETDEVLQIYFDSSSGTHADVSVTATGVSLHSINNSGVESTDETALFATYKTITTLAAQINTVTGWTATVQNSMGTSPSALLRPFNGEWALYPDYASLDVPSTGNGVRIKWATDRTVERLDGFSFPCAYDSVFVWYVAGYTLPEDDTGHSQLATAGNLPGGLTMAVNQILLDVYRSRKRDTTIKSESISGYSYSYGTVQESMASRSALLSSWRKKVI